MASIAPNAPKNFSQKENFKMCRRISLISLTVGLCFVHYAGSTKFWIGNSPNFMDPLSWEDRNPPCALDTILFPEQYSAAVFLPQNLEVNGIVFPKEGVVLLENNAKINFGGEEKQDKLCKNKNHLAKIKEVKTKFWFDTANWIVDSKGSQSDAKPHVERIPCANDKVVINHAGALSIDLDDTEDLFIGGLSFNEEEMSVNQLDSFLKTELGQIIFKNADDVQVRFFDEPICGCHRPETALEFQWRVCKYTSKSCSVPHCMAPIAPTGHCCAICGSMVKIHIDDCKNFNSKLFEKQVRNTITAQNLQADLDFHAGMVDDGIEKYLQLVITDKNGYDEKSTDFMEFLNETLLKHAYRDMQQIFHSSGLPYIPGGGVSGWVFFFVTLLSVAVFFVVIYVYYNPENPYISVPPWLYPSRYGSDRSSIVFARFENSPVEVEAQARGNVIMNVAYEEDDGARAESSTTSFDNPMFAEKNEKEVEVGQDAIQLGEKELTTVSLDKLEEEN